MISSLNLSDSLRNNFVICYSYNGKKLLGYVDFNYQEYKIRSKLFVLPFINSFLLEIQRQ